jgi:hypothetical protein
MLKRHQPGYSQRRPVGLGEPGRGEPGCDRRCLFEAQVGERGTEDTRREAELGCDGVAAAFEREGAQVERIAAGDKEPLETLSEVGNDAKVAEERLGQWASLHREILDDWPSSCLGG